MGIDVITTPRIRLTRRVNEMQVSPTLAVMNRALELRAAGVDIVDFGPGEPDFPTPESVCAAGKRAIDDGLTKYTSGNGTKELGDAWGARDNRRYGETRTAEEV